MIHSIKDTLVWKIDTAWINYSYNLFKLEMMCRNVHSFISRHTERARLLNSGETPTNEPFKMCNYYPDEKTF